MPANPSNRLVVAFLLYGILAASAFFTLHGEVRAFVLIFFAALAAKTWLAHARAQLDLAQSDRDETLPESNPVEPKSPLPPANP
jgi:hypothetical protein